MPRKNNVLFITFANVSKSEGGPGRFLCDLVEDLPKISTWYCSFSGEKPTEISKHNFNKSSSKSPSRHGVKAKARQLVNQIPILGPLLYLLRLHIKRRRILSCLKTDANWTINAHDFLSAFCFTSSKNKEKLIFTTHAKGSNYKESIQYKEPYHKRWDWKMLFLHIEEKVISNADKITFPSSGARSLLFIDYPHLLDKIGEKSEIIHTGIRKKQTENWNPHAPPRRTLLSIANHIPAKNVLKTAIALKKLKDKKRDFNLVNFGKTGPCTQELLQYVAKNDLNESVNLKGIVAPDEILSAMHSADALIMSAEITVFDLVILEAISIGLPIITTRLEGFIEALGEDYPLYADTPEEIADKVLQLSESTALRIAISERLLQRYKTKFKLSTMIQHYTNLVER